MATWRAENSMLTAKGIEILNKIKAGIGSITVTRVVAGSGRVPESQLSVQTNVSGNTKPMTISQVFTQGLGSEISIYIVNDDFTEDFSLNQIGVYVTHKDYEGEQLYHISQCDAGKSDNIPPLGETPVTFGYSIYLEHGNSESIEVTVSPQGMLSYEQFNTFKGNLSQNSLVSTDENGNLKSVGKSIEQVFNKNLLHNSYFKNPVNTRNGYVVNKGTPYYSNTTLSTQAGTTTTYSKVTPVNSAYGIITVSGTVYYVSMSSVVKGYCVPWEQAINRWFCAGDGIIVLHEDGAYIYGAFDQFASVILSPGDYTASFLFNDGTVQSKTFYYDGETHAMNTIGATYFNVDPLTGHQDGRPRIRIYPISEEIGDRKFVYAKLEHGTVCSILSDLPIDYAEQASICAQYDAENGSYLGSVPYGYIENSITVSSATDLDAKLDLILSRMPRGKIRFILVEFTVEHPSLGGGSRVFRIDKIWDDYCVIQALGYREESLGAVSEFFRSKFQGKWTSWARTYNTLFKPTLAELGAAPLGFGLGETAVNTANSNANLITRTGFYGCNVNTPDGTWWFGTHIQYSPNYSYQRFVKTNDTVSAERWCFNGSWTSWKTSTGTVVPATVE